MIKLFEEYKVGEDFLENFFNHINEFFQSILIGNEKSRFYYQDEDEQTPDEIMFIHDDISTHSAFIYSENENSTKYNYSFEFKDADNVFVFGDDNSEGIHVGLKNYMTSVLSNYYIVEESEGYNEAKIDDINKIKDIEFNKEDYEIFKDTERFGL